MAQTPIDDALAMQMVDELAGLAHMELMLRPSTVFELVGLLQLAQRHPELPASIRATAARFVISAREYFADCPTVLAIIQRGEDPQEDR